MVVVASSPLYHQHHHHHHRHSYDVGTTRGTFLFLGGWWMKCKCKYIHIRPDCFYLVAGDDLDSTDLTAVAFVVVVVVGYYYYYYPYEYEHEYEYCETLENHTHTRSVAIPFQRRGIHYYCTSPRSSQTPMVVVEEACCYYYCYYCYCEQWPEELSVSPPC